MFDKLIQKAIANGSAKVKASWSRTDATGVKCTLTPKKAYGGNPQDTDAIVETFGELGGDLKQSGKGVGAAGTDFNRAVTEMVPSLAVEFAEVMFDRAPADDTTDKPAEKPKQKRTVKADTLPAPLVSTNGTGH